MKKKQILKNEFIMINDECKDSTSSFIRYHLSFGSFFISKRFITQIILLFIIHHLLFIIPITAQTASKTGTNSGSKTSSAVFELESTTKGLLLPRLTTAQMSAIASPVTGLMVFNTSDSCIYLYRGIVGGWTSMLSPSYVAPWNLLGNSGTNSATNFIGTTDAVDWIVRTSNTERMRVLSSGNVGMGTATPSQPLDIVVQNPAADNIHFTSYGTNPTPTLRLRAAQGTPAAPTYLSNGTMIGGYINAATSGVANGFIDVTSVKSYATEAHSATATGANMVFYVTANGTTTSTEAMRIENTGYVGIGTTVPVNQLHVKAASDPVKFEGLQSTGSGIDSVLAVDPSTGVVRYRKLRTAAKSDSTNFWKILGNSGTTPGTHFFGTTDGQDLVFKTNNIETARLTTGGFIGVSTASPNAQLSLGQTFSNPGASTNSFTTYRKVTIMQNPSDEYGVGVSAGSLDLYKSLGGSGANQLMVRFGNHSGSTQGFYSAADNLANCGRINNRWATTYSTYGVFDAQTGASGNPLYLYGLLAGATSDSIISSNVGVINRLSIPQVIANAWNISGNTGTTAGTNFMGTTDAQDLVFKTSNTEKMRINTSGSLGIGTASPTANLHIYGNGVSGFTLGGTSSVPSPVGGPEIGYSRGGFYHVGSAIQMIDYNNYSSGLAFNVHKGTNNSGGGTFADNWPTEVTQAMTIVNNGQIGMGTTDPNATLDVSGSVARAINTTTVSLTLDITYYTLIITGGTPTITLPAATTCARRIYVIVNNSGSARTVQVSAGTGWVAFGASTAVTTSLANASSIAIESNGTSWYRIR